MDVPYKEIANLVAHTWRDEEKHFEECFKNDSSPKQYQKHIFNDLKIIQNWLSESYISPSLLEKHETISSKISNWREFTAHIVTSYCKEINATTFTLQDLQHAKKHEIENFSKANKHPFDKVRQQLQFLRKDGYICFVDNNGTYSLTNGNDSVLSS